MAKVTLNNGMFELLQAPPQLPDWQLDYAAQLEGLEAAVHGTARALQLSSSLIRVGFTPPSWSGDKANFEVQLSGSGIKPISNLNNLMNAIDDGLATGGISSLVGLRNGVEVLRLSLSPTAWVLTSGTQVLTLWGALPVTFQTIFGLEALLGRVDDMDTMTATERAAFFTDLSVYGVNGLTLTDHGATRFQLSETPTAISLTVAGVTLTATGNFPINFGAIASDLYDAMHQVGATGSVDVLSLIGSGVTGLSITNPAGSMVLNATDLQGATDQFIFSGRTYAEWVGADGGNWSDWVMGASGTTASLLTGLGGDDSIWGYAGNDALIGGNGHDFLYAGDGADLINGGAGFDRAVYTANVNLSVDLTKSTGQVTGQGTDTLSGIEAVTTAGGHDYLRGNGAANGLSGLGGNDLLEGEAGNDTLGGGMGNDTLVGMRGDDEMWGGAGADVFRFFAVNGVMTAGHDVIMDFDPAFDRLSFAPSGGVAPWAGMSKGQFIANYVHLEGGDIVISLAADQSIRLDGHFTTLAGFGYALNLL